MFFIVNRTKSKVHFPDLKITLGPRQAIDLDKMVDRKVADASETLRASISQAQIEVRVKDNINLNPPQKTPVTKDSGLESLKKDILNEIKHSIKEMTKEITPQPPIINQTSGITKEDLNNLRDTILSSLSSSQIEKIVKGEEVDIDEDVLAAINAKAVNNIVKDVDVKSMRYDEKKTENTILNNVEELGDLLQ